jgi:sigma-54 specific flagellar transcriptional regulator A
LIPYWKYLSGFARCARYKAIYKSGGSVKGLVGRIDCDGSPVVGDDTGSARFPSGSSAAVSKVVSLIRKVSGHDSSVLVLGQSGTGKEVVARAIHDSSPRRRGAFVAVNCGAIPSELLESELFGHEKGAFTGAYSSRRGRFEIAEGGTLFLDEIGDMSLSMQVKMLRVLQERVFERVGSHQPIRCDVRIIAATHRNLEEAIARGGFRSDLFYRLNVFPIEMPSLRDRAEDLEILVEEFAQANVRAGRPMLEVSAVAMRALRGYHWPGNVRELGNLIERLSILNGEKTVELCDLPERYREHLGGNVLEDASIVQGRFDAVPGVICERIAIQESLVDCMAESAAPGRATERSAYVVGFADRCMASVEEAVQPMPDVEIPIRSGSAAGGAREGWDAPAVAALPAEGVDLRAHLFAIEHRLISEALERSGGTVAHAARLLNLRRTTLVEKLRKLGMAETETLQG